MAEIIKRVLVDEGLVTLNPSVLVLEAIDEHSEIATPPKELIHEDALNVEALKEEAYQSGLHQGYEEGVEHANQQMKEQKDSLMALLTSLPRAVSDNRQQLSTEIADIVMTIVQQFFIHQQITHEGIAKQINQTLDELNDKQTIELSLHPEDIRLVEQNLLNLELTPFKELRIVADEQLRLGGCKIKSEHGVFDAGIERQIDRLKEVLLQIKQGGLRE